MGNRKKDNQKDSWVADFLFVIPELIIYPIKWVFRGIFTLIK
ncbi:hypothetical protein ACJROX_02855 [Pseudalkalibacillus sp. A8]